MTDKSVTNSVKHQQLTTISEESVLTVPEHLDKKDAVSSSSVKIPQVTEVLLSASNLSLDSIKSKYKSIASRIIKQITVSESLQMENRRKMISTVADGLRQSSLSLEEIESNLNPVSSYVSSFASELANPVSLIFRNSISLESRDYRHLKERIAGLTINDMSELRYRS